MGVQKPFLTSTGYTMSITDIQCKTYDVCKIFFFCYFICFLYMNVAFFIFSYYFMCFIDIYIISTCDFGVDSPRKTRGLSPWKPVPMCPVGPCVLHREMFGLILTCSKTLVYLKKLKKNFNYCVSRNIPPGVIFIKHQVACRYNSVYVFVNCFQIFK